MPEKTLTRAGRLVVLLAMKELGILKGKSLQEIANIFPNPPHRSAIFRDLKDLPRLAEIVKELAK